MYWLLRYPWYLSFVSALALLAFVVFSGREFIDFLSLAIWFALILVGCAAIAAICWSLFLIFPWRSHPRARQGLNSALRGFFLLVLLANAYNIWLTSDAGHVQKAKDFVKLAEPKIEQYYGKNHLYPPSLASLNLDVPVPIGLDYRVVSHVAGDDEWVVESTHDGERYTLFFGDLWYHGNGEWALGHL